MTVTTAGFRLEEKAVRTLKATAAERGTTLSAIAQEALAQWWERQPERKTKGPLFTAESEVATPEATQEKTTAPNSEATKSEPSTTKKGAAKKK